MRLGIRKGLINIPKDIRTPVICIGPGTGIAPMRAVIQDRIHAGSSCTFHPDVQEMRSWNSILQVILSILVAGRQTKTNIIERSGRLMPRLIFCHIALLARETGLTD